MKPDVLVHFADRIALIGVYEGLWWGGVEEPDGMYVRLDDGTRIIVVGRCDYDLPADYGIPVVNAVHDHRHDTLRWIDPDGRLHVESCALART